MKKIGSHYSLIRNPFPLLPVNGSNLFMSVLPDDLIIS